MRGFFFISIHAPPRGATNPETSPKKSIFLFQFTPLREGRRVFFTVHRNTICYFNSRPSARGDIYTTLFFFHPLISIHAPPRGATGLRGHPAPCGASYFNSRPSARGDSCCPCQCRQRKNFNSRPSARGDTLAWIKDNNGDISIHAPPRGATNIVANVCRQSCYFNSRPSARGDGTLAWIEDNNGGISIHAPPRGATLKFAGGGTQYLISIHAPPRGATRGNGDGTHCPTLFQFTPLREGRPANVYRLRLVRRHFNSRPSARGDASPTGGASPTTRFQFTPLREGRLKLSRSLRSCRIPRFQFTPLREGRLDQQQEKAREKADFNSRPSARGDGKRYAISANLLFNPYKSAWLNNSATQFVEIILVIFHRIIA